LAAAEPRLDRFWQNLEEGAETMMRYMDARIAFMIRDSGFFETNFLVREGFITPERFTGMFGLVGLAECVNTLLADKSCRFGRDEEADKLGLEILGRLDELVKAHGNPYCGGTGGHFLLHGQVGLDTDTGETPAARIPIGEEPEELIDHIRHCGLFHRFFPAGIGEVFVVEASARGNPESVLDLVKGGFSEGGRYFSIHSRDSDVIRITGYLVKRSEMDKLSRGNQVLQNTTALGLGAVRNARILERKLR
jgi:YjjI family glycine radical enzyme